MPAVGSSTAMTRRSCVLVTAVLVLFCASLSHANGSETSRRELLADGSEPSRAGLLDEIRSIVRSEVQSVRAELRSEVQGLRAELRSEVQGLRAELRSEVQGLRAELLNEIQGVRSEVRGVRAELLNEILGVRTEQAELRAELGGVRTRVDDIANSMFLTSDAPRIHDSLDEASFLLVSWSDNATNNRTVHYGTGFALKLSNTSTDVSAFSQARRARADAGDDTKRHWRYRGWLKQLVLSRSIR